MLKNQVIWIRGFRREKIFPSIEIAFCLDLFPESPNKTKFCTLHFEKMKFSLLVILLVICIEWSISVKFTAQGKKIT